MGGGVELACSRRLLIEFLEVWEDDERNVKVWGGHQKERKCILPPFSTPVLPSDTYLYVANPSVSLCNLPLSAWQPRAGQKCLPSPPLLPIGPAPPLPVSVPPAPPPRYLYTSPVPVRDHLIQVHRRDDDLDSL